MKWSATSGQGNNYQILFNRAYILSLPPAVQQLHIGEVGWLNDDGSDTVEMDPGERFALAQTLAAGGAPVDLWVDAEGMDPYGTNSVRMAYGQTKVQLLNSATRVVSVNPADYPPFATGVDLTLPINFNLVGPAQTPTQYATTPICLMLITHGQISDGDLHVEGGVTYKMQITQTLMGPTYLWIKQGA